MSNFTVTKIETGKNIHDEHLAELSCNDGTSFWILAGPGRDSPEEATIAVMALFTGDKGAWEANGCKVKPTVWLDSILVEHVEDEDSLAWVARAKCVDGEDEWELEARMSSPQAALREVEARFNSGPDCWAVYGNKHPVDMCELGS